MKNTPFSEPFILYNNYYDLLYQDKNYEKEAEYISAILQHYHPQAKEIIELGSGTGNYSVYLCKSGYDVTGIERNEQMVDAAKFKSIPKFHPIVNDIVTFELNRTFDATVSLFHVMNYLTENRAILSCFKQIAKHLKPNGIFVFDAWYSPAVYSQSPESRVKYVENDLYEITRHAEPVMLHEKNIVEVNYEMIIKNKLNNEYELLKEAHSMRHFSTPEIEMLADLSGFKLLKSEEFLTGKNPGADTWGVCYILQKHD